MGLRGGMVWVPTEALQSNSCEHRRPEYQPFANSTRPNHFLVVSKAIGNSVIKDLYIQNYPVHCFTISGSDGLILENITLNNTSGDAPNSRSNGLAASHNSDGFDISSTNGLILRNSTVLNQDDCVAITSGDSITVQDMYCDGEPPQTYHLLMHTLTDSKADTA